MGLSCARKGEQIIWLLIIDYCLPTAYRTEPNRTIVNCLSTNFGSVKILTDLPNQTAF